MQVCRNPLTAQTHVRIKSTKRIYSKNSTSPSTTVCLAL